MRTLTALCISCFISTSSQWVSHSFHRRSKNSLKISICSQKSNVEQNIQLERCKVQETIFFLLLSFKWNKITIGQTPHFVCVTQRIFFSMNILQIPRDSLFLWSWLNTVFYYFVEMSSRTVKKLSLFCQTLHSQIFN